MISDSWADGDAGDRSRWCCGGRRWFQATLLQFFLLPYVEAPFFLPVIFSFSPLSLLCLSSSSSSSVPPAFFLKFPFCFTPKTLLFHLLVRSFFLKQKSSSPCFLIFPPSSLLSFLSLLCLSNKSPPPLLFSPSSPSPSLLLSFSFLLFHSPVSLFRFLLFSSSSTPPLSFSSLPYSSFFFFRWSSLPSSLCSGNIYRGRGSVINPAPSHHFTWGVRSSCSVTTLGEVANGGVACRARLLCFLIIRRCGWHPVLVVTKHVGREREEKTRKKKQKPLFPCCTSRGRRMRNNAA